MSVSLDAPLHRSSSPNTKNGITEVISYISTLDLQDIQTLQSRAQRANTNAGLTDQELALALFAAEAEGLLNIAREHAVDGINDVTRSIDVLEELEEMEEAARYDHLVALAISEGNPIPPRPDRPQRDRRRTTSHAFPGVPAISRPLPQPESAQEPLPPTTPSPQSRLRPLILTRSNGALQAVVSPQQQHTSADDAQEAEHESHPAITHPGLRRPNTLDYAKRRMLSSPEATISHQRLISPHEDVRRRYAQATGTSSQVPPYQTSMPAIIRPTISGASTRTRSSQVSISGLAGVGFAGPNEDTRISPSYGHPESVEPGEPVACSVGTLKGKTRCLQPSEDCSGSSQTTVKTPYSQNMPLEYPPIVPATIPRSCSPTAQVASTSTDTAARPNVSPLATRSTVLEQYSQLLHRANTRSAPSMVATEAVVRRSPPTAVDLPRVSVSSRTLISPATTRPPVAPEAGPSAPFRSTRSTTLGLWSRMNSRNYIVQSGPSMASRPEAGSSNAVHYTPESYDESPEDYSPSSIVTDLLPETEPSMASSPEAGLSNAGHYTPESYQESPEDYSPSSIVSEPLPKAEPSMRYEFVEATASPTDYDYTPSDSPARTPSPQSHIASCQLNEVERASQDSTPFIKEASEYDYTPPGSPARTPSPQPYIVSEQRRGVEFPVPPEDQFNVDEEITFVELPRTPVEITWGGTVPRFEDYDGPFEEYVSEAVVQAREDEGLAEGLVTGYHDELEVGPVPCTTGEFVEDAYDGPFEDIATGAVAQVREVGEAVDHIPYAEEELGVEDFNSPVEEVAAESVEYEGPFEEAYAVEAVAEEREIEDYDPFQSLRSNISCTICGDEVWAPYTAPCGHAFDSRCLGDMFRRATHDESLYPPRCCQQHIPLSSVRALLPASVASAFTEKAREYDTRDRVYCHRSRCSAFLGAATAGPSSVYCPRCPDNVATCGMCKEEAHPGTKCSDTRELNQLAVDMRTRQGWQRCYSCGHLVDKFDGCHHITCMCKAEFCYLCAAPWKTCGCDRFEVPPEGPPEGPV